MLDAAAAPDLHIMVVAGVVLSGHIRLATAEFAHHVCFGPLASVSGRMATQKGSLQICMHAMCLPHLGRANARRRSCGGQEEWRHKPRL
jgi:hypothetical protein